MHKMTQQRGWTLVVALIMLLGTPPTAGASNTQDAGDALFVLLPLAGLATATVKKDREGQAQFLKALLTNAAITGGLKALVDKRRPDGSCCDSFPSGHTSFAFMGASFLHQRYGRKYGIPAFAAATFVGYSRVFADKHFVEDVLAGAAIGYLSSHLFTSSYRGVSLTPVAGHDFIGIAFNKAW